MKAKATYSVKKWEEVAIREIAGPMKFTKASVIYQLGGDLEGTASVEYIMFYRHFDPEDQHSASATYVSLIHFEGTLFGKSGAFVLEDDGAFEAGAANSRIRIVDGSGTGGLNGIYGTGFYRANKDGFHFELDCDFHG